MVGNGFRDLGMGEDGWSPVERLILGHAILKHPTSTFAVISRSIRQATNLTTIVSHDLNFFSAKVNL